jgi:hypothetical protein
VRWRDATASSFAAKVRGEVFTRFHAVAVKRHGSMRNWVFGLPGRILCEQSSWCQRKLRKCSWLCTSPFPVSVNLDFPCTARAFFPERLTNHCQGVRHTLFEIYTKCDAQLLSDPSRNRVRPDTRLQIKWRKKSAHQPSGANFVHWLPRHASTNTYRYITLLQQLYRWRHQSRKLWISRRCYMT